MSEPTNISATIDSIEEDKLTLDKNIKELLSDIQILAYIIKYIVKDVSDLSMEEIKECIDEKSIIVDETYVMPGFTNSNLKKVEMLQTEDSVPNEGYITYDVRFSLRYKEENLKVIINVEAQKSSKLTELKYHIENRIQFYIARLISSQKNVEFIKSNYDDIKKVYSIWICMGADKDGDSITLIETVARTVFGKELEFPELDKMNGAIICIRSTNDVEESKHNLIAMLEDLLRNEDKETKKKKLAEKHNLVMTEEFERRIEEVCNVSDVIVENAMERGRVQTYFELVFDKTVTIELAAQKVNMPIKKFAEEFEIWKAKRVAQQK